MNKMSSFVTSCSNCKLSRLCLPQGLITSELEELKSIVSPLHTIKSRDTIFTQGEPFKYIYILRAGCVKVFSTDMNGVEQVVSFTLPGELLGLDAIAGEKHNTSAIALDTISLCRIEYDFFEDLCMKIPKLSKHILKIIGRELVTEQDLRYALSQKSAEERIAIFIMSMSTRYGLLGYSRNEFTFPMTRGDIANYLGMSAETVSRRFAQLREQGVLDINKNIIRINKPEHLMTLAGHCVECPTNNIAV